MTEPQWFIDGKQLPITTDFMRDRDRACIHWQHTFYSDDLSDQAIAKKICSTCPVLHECTLWALLGRCDTEFGIVAGMEPRQRRRIRDGRETFSDWTESFNYNEAKLKAKYRQRDNQRRRHRETNFSSVPRSEPGRFPATQ